MDLISSFDGGWQRRRLPDEAEIRPFEALQYEGLEKPAAAGGIGVPSDNSRDDDLTQSSRRCDER